MATENARRAHSRPAPFEQVCLTFELDISARVSSVPNKRAIFPYPRSQLIILDVHAGDRQRPRCGLPLLRARVLRCPDGGEHRRLHVRFCIGFRSTFHWMIKLNTIGGDLAVSPCLPLGNIDQRCHVRCTRALLCVRRPFVRPARLGPILYV